MIPTTETKTEACKRLLAEGKTYAEIATALGTSSNSLRVLMWKDRHPEDAKAAARADYEHHRDDRLAYRRQWEANNREHVRYRDKMARIAREARSEGVAK